MMNTNQTSSNMQPFPWKYAVLGSFLETVVRQPLMATSSVMIVSQKSMKESALQLYRKGKISAFYGGAQGAGIAFSQRIAHRTTTFKTNQYLKEKGYDLFFISTVTAFQEIGLTMVGEMVITANQISSKNETPMNILKQKITNSGVRALGAGFLAALSRNISFNAFYFGIGHHFPIFVSEYPVESAIYSSVAAVCASHPFEILRVKKINHLEKSYLLLTSELFKESKFAWCTKGIVPRMMQAGGGSFTALAVFNIAKAIQ